MNTIRFSHEYPKLHGQTSAELLAVRSLKVDAHTPKELLDYDTTYDGGRYPLRSGEYIQLIFLGNLRIPFCTIRNAYPPSKVRYYRGSVGRCSGLRHRQCVLAKTVGTSADSGRWRLTSTRARGWRPYNVVSRRSPRPTWRNIAGGTSGRKLRTNET